MRDILFRGKCKDDGEWVYGCYWFRESDWLHFIGLDDHEGEFISFEVIPETVGMVKSDSVYELSEGDIIKYIAADGKESIGIIEFSEGEFGVKAPAHDEDDDIQRLWWIECEERIIAVLGNIHDNPELLKEEI